MEEEKRIREGGVDSMPGSEERQTPAMDKTSVEVVMTFFMSVSCGLGFGLRFGANKFKELLFVVLHQPFSLLQVVPPPSLVAPLLLAVLLLRRVALLPLWVAPFSHLIAPLFL